MSHVFRIHPTIGFARVGNSEEYNLAPETMAALPLPNGGRDTEQGEGTVGGLPLRRDGITTITSRDVRDAEGKLKRQAARFKIFAYHDSGSDSYPSDPGVEITIGSEIDGKVVRNLLWTVHVANKKANCYVLEAPSTTATPLIEQYQRGLLPPLRNLEEGEWAGDPIRVKKLTIDPGPRAILGDETERMAMDEHSMASYVNCHGEVKDVPGYQKLFPSRSFDRLYQPDGPIETLGELETDEVGRLHVIAAYGRAVAWYPKDSATPYGLPSPVDNDGWFDDTCDGPVNAVIVFDDGSRVEVAGAWVVTTDPGFAPQTLNSVSLWDDIYDTWVRELDLEPSLYKDGQYQRDYEPDFAQQLYPFFRSAAVLRWNANLPDLAIRAHDAVGDITEVDTPSETILGGLGYIRNPNKLEQSRVGPPLMPLSLGDSGVALLSASKTQYFFLEQWDAGVFKASDAGRLGPGEYLDKASLINCLGGRFSPGIDMTFIVRQPQMWDAERASRASKGPFRICQQPLNYAELPPEDLPMLGEGWVPCHGDSVGLQPGDTSKFMSVPWHTDYNSCAVHTPDPKLTDNNTLYWSWPAQRPVAVNVAIDTLTGGVLPGQRWSVRGPGTGSKTLEKASSFQDYEEIITNWSKIGTIIQRTQIEGLPNQDAIDELPADSFLEVESQLDDSFVTTWPMNSDESSGPRS